jgi:hypothetical protein
LPTADAKRQSTGRPGEVMLKSDAATAVVVPSEGGRVASIIDRRSGRELLYQQQPRLERSPEYLDSLAGGWDQMFPSDDPDFGYPTHGVLWSTPFEVRSSSATEVVLEAALESPAVMVVYRYELSQATPALRMSVHITANAPVGPFLWNSHPMLAIDEGWRIEAAAVRASVDPVLPGRFVGRDHVGLQALEVPKRGLGLTEVLYVDDVTEARVRSSEMRVGTSVSWAGSFFRHLWVCSVSADDGIDHAVVLEASTANAFQLPRAVDQGTAASMAEGERASWSVTVESLDQPDR